MLCKLHDFNLSFTFTINVQYGFWVLIWALIFGVIGAILLFLGLASKDILDTVCGTAKSSYSDNQFLKDIQNSVTDFDTNVNKWSAKSFCTTQCPCYSGSYNSSQWAEDTLKKYNRTKLANYTLNGVSYVSLVTSTNSSASYKNFRDCYNNVLAKQDSSTYSISSFTDDFIKNIEDIFDCNGICKTGLFYYSLDLNQGPPNKICLNQLKDTF